MRSLWSSPFRPFYLLGALYAPVLGLAWLAAWTGLWAPGGLPLSLWHGHEFLFGFSAAIILGIVLTALPSWAGTEELQGGPLVFLAALWLLGRLAVWGAWPWLLAAMLDGALFLAAAWLTTPQVWRAPNPLYRLLLPILLGLALANLGFHFGVGTGDLALAESSLRLAVYVIVVLYALKGGVLVPIFTGNALREKGRGDQARFLMPLDVAAVLAVVVLAACDLARAPGSVTGGVALAAFTLHAWRCARWRGWQAHDVPLVFVTHLGFLWLLIALASKALAEFGLGLPKDAWLHAFTVGGLGLMMLGLMTRVSLRHTGRALRVPALLRLAYGLMFIAALARYLAALKILTGGLIALSALLWIGAFVLYLVQFAPVLLSPSLPRKAAEAPTR